VGSNPISHPKLDNKMSNENENRHEQCSSCTKRLDESTVYICADCDTNYCYKCIPKDHQCKCGGELIEPS
jgi:hypothetical protein